MCEVFLTESHPEASTLDSGEVDDEALKLFVIHQIGFARTDIRVVERTMHRERVGFNPFAILIVFSALSDFADIDFGVEIGGECLSVVTCVAVNDVEVFHFGEMVLGGVGGIDARHSGVETATEDSGKTCLFKSFAISPLPTVLVFCFIERLVVGGVEIVHATFKTSVHNGEVLIGESHIDNDVGAVALEQFDELRHAVGIDGVGSNIWLSNSLSHGIAFSFCSRCDDDFGENIGVLSAFVCGDSAHTTCSDNKYFSHFLSV